MDTLAEVFTTYKLAYGWDLPTQLEVLQVWYGEGLMDWIMPLMDHANGLEEFEEFLADSWGELPPNPAGEVGGNEEEGHNWIIEGF